MTNRQTGELTGYPSIDKPWLKYYSEEAINTPVPECSIYEYMLENNKDYPADSAILYLRRKITYKELFENIDRVAASFLKVGVKEKEIVTVALPSIPEALYCIYALNKIGAVANVIHPLAGKEETLNLFNEVQSRIAVIFEGAYETIADDVGKTSVEEVIVVSPADSLPFAYKIAYRLKVKKPDLDGKVFKSWKAFVRDGKDTSVKAVKKDCREIAVISHTGGTTGEPKGVMLSDRNIVSIIWQVSKTLPVVRQERQMVVLPPFVNYSLVNSMLEPVALGNTAVLIPDYRPEKLGEYISKYKPAWICSIPPYWEVMLSKHFKRRDLSCLKYPIYGGEGMSPENEIKINDVLRECRVKRKLSKGLGATELTSVATLTRLDSTVGGNAGLPLPKINVKILGTEINEELGYNQEGEICFSGPSLMLGYYDNSQETDSVIRVHADGERWFHTGDLGYITENGEVNVTGRIKRLMITKGKDGNPAKMYPDRIEKAIYRHPSVELCCVIGVSDRERVNYPKAFILLKNKEDEENVKEQVLEICRENLPEYMVPEEISFVKEMPRTPRGKIDYRALEEQEL